MPSCGECGVEFEKGENFVICNVCNNTFHVTKECTGVNTASEMKALELKSNRILVFRCKQCTANNGINPSINEVINDINKKLASLTTIENDIRELKENIGQIRIQEEFDNIKKDILDLKNSVSEDSLIEEFTLRQKKQLNFLILNLIDRNNDTQDAKQLKKIFENIIDDPSTLSPVRLGKYEKGKDRPLLIRAENMDQLKTVFKNKEKITSFVNDTSGKKIGLTADKTKKQRENLKIVLEELNKRKLQGENNITLKYYNGVPKIVQIKNKLIAPTPLSPSQSTDDNQKE